MISLVNFFIIASCLGMSHAANCHLPWQSQDFIDRVISHCPGLTDTADREYCCLDSEGKFVCCNFVEFFLLYIIIAAVVIFAISVICCVISCCCCPCCFFYKRRHGAPV